jgi:hypothetical protein
MKIANTRLVAATVLVALATSMPLLAQSAAAPPAAPDSTLYTTYTGGPTTINWLVCGSTQQSSGCYASGSIGPFVGVGAMLEGNPLVSGDVVTRAIYVVDSGASAVKLYVYKKTDTVSASFDTVTVTLSKTVTLPLTGSSTAECFMAANRSFLFIGTNQTAIGAEVQKSNLAVSDIPGFSPPINVSSITSDQYGYVTVTFGNSSESGFSLYGPSGTLQEDGGGLDFTLVTTQAVSGAALLNATGVFAPKIGWKMKAAQEGAQ